MSASAILEAAYKAGIVPSHLYGKTQQKTLQARLSEEILEHKRNCTFFRTEPGIFFLTELISDPSIPEKYKNVFPARRRTRELFNAPALAIKKSLLDESHGIRSNDWLELLDEARREDAIRYVHPKDVDAEYLLVWSFSLVRRHQNTLGYRVGRYRDDRDLYANRKTIGFPGLLNTDSHTLFSMRDFGATECATESIFTDLDLSANSFDGLDSVAPPEITNILIVDEHLNKPVLLLVMQWQCPNWLEPTSRRLSLNNLGWLDISRAPNDLEDFEPWSQATLEALQTT